MNSGNHVMLIGDLVVWFYEYLAGIAPDDAQPGFKHIIMRPMPVGDLNFVKATHNSPYGLIASEWHRDGNKFDWQIEIPANTTATVVVPNLSDKGFAVETSNRKNNVKSIVFLLSDGSQTVYGVGSGKYHFVSE
jgi:alpha-L-rhamnosidase